MTEPTVAALFVRADTFYRTLPGVDCWDEARDARNWPGGCPVVAHPPCKRWSSLNNLVLARYPDQAERFAHGNDGDLFALALSHVREFGGVLEHPAFSRAWRTFDLPRPGPNVWQRGVCGGWSIELDQAAFGHIARKRTWLYAFGAVPPLPPTPAADTGRRVRVYRKRNPDGSWSRMDDGQTPEITHALAEKAADVAEREEQLRGYADVMEARRARRENDMWRIAEVLSPGCSEKGMSNDWLRSITKFIDQLGLYVVLEAAELARDRKSCTGSWRFRYFCGICWNKVRAN